MPSGLKIDYTVSNDAVGRGGPNGGSTNYTWNTFWDVKTARTIKPGILKCGFPFQVFVFRALTI
jgi:hypothetical protein